MGLGAGNRFTPLDVNHLPVTEPSFFAGPNLHNDNLAVDLYNRSPRDDVKSQTVVVGEIVIDRLR